MQSDVWEQIRTKSELQEAITQIQLLKDGLYQRPGEFTKILENTVSSRFAEIIRRELHGQELNADNDNLKNLLREMENNLRQFKTLKLIIAKELSDSIIGQLHDWIYQNFGKDIVLDLEIDPSVIGGAKIYFQGKYGDFTLDKKLSEINWKTMLEE